MSKSLRTIFLTAALSTSALIPGLPLELVTPAHANSAAAAATLKRFEEEAKFRQQLWKEVIASPSDKNIDNLVKGHAIPAPYLPFLCNSINDMNIPSGTQPEQVTNEQLEQLKSSLHEKYLTTLISSTSPSEAVEKGMWSEHARYFNKCKEEFLKVNSQTKSAWEFEQCLRDNHQEYVMNGVLLIAGVTAGACLTLGGIDLYRNRYRRNKHSSPNRTAGRL